MNTFMDALGYFAFIFLELGALFFSISTVILLILQYIPKERFGH